MAGLTGGPDAGAAFGVMRRVLDGEDIWNPVNQRARNIGVAIGVSRDRSFLRTYLAIEIQKIMLL
jgi:hypothetical protein